MGILLEKGGFENLEILTPGELDVDIVRNKILEGKLSIKKLPFLGEAIINNNYNNLKIYI